MRKKDSNRKGKSAKGEELADRIMAAKSGRGPSLKKDKPAPETGKTVSSGRDLFSVIEEIFKYGCESIALRKGNIDIICKISSVR